MLQAYSIGKELSANSIVPFDNVKINKGCCVAINGSTINLNKCGIYEVSVNGVSSASTTLQLVVDGVPLPEAQTTGTTLGFNTLVQVDRNNSKCDPCSSPVIIQVSNSDAVTLQNVNIVVLKKTF